MKALSKAQIITGLRGYAAMIFSIAASPVLHAAGVSFQTISLGYGILYSILALAEIPTGISADIFGAKKASILGGILQAFALVLFSFGSIHSFQILTGFALYGLGSSFISGALSALMFGSAKSEDGESFNSNQYFSATEKVAVASYVLASASVGVLSQFFGRYSFLLAGCFFLLASTFVAMALNEQNRERKHHSLLKEYSDRLSLGFKAIKNSVQLKVLLPVRMLHQIETILGVLWIPWVIKLGGGNGIWMSVMATGSYTLRYLVNHQFSKKSAPKSYMPRIALSLMVMALGTLICVFATNVWAALFGIWTMASARGAFLPAVQAIQHLEFNEEVRSTGLSVMNFSTEVMIAISYFVSAPIIDQLTVSYAWAISVVAFGMAALLARLTNHNIKERA